MNVLFADRLHRTHIAVLRPYLKITDMALRDAETSGKTNQSGRSSIQQPLVQCKLQHISPSVLAVTEKPRPVPIAFIHYNQNFGY